MASGLNTSRHGYGKDNESRYGISSDEKAKREAFDSLAQSWIDRGNGWVSVPRYNNDNNRSPEFLRGRELGYNQSRHVWTGKGVKKQPAKFNEKAKSSSAYNEWYYDYVRSMSMYLSGIEQLPDKEKKNDSDFYDGIDNAIRADVYSKRPDTNTWGENEKDALSRWLNAYGFSDSSSSKPEKRLSSGKLPGLDEDFDPDNPYGEENVPYDENSMDLYDRIIRDFLGTEPERPKVTKIPAPEKKPEDYTDRDIYEERMAGASLEQMAEKLGTTRVEIRRAEQRHMAEMRRSRTENAAASTEKKLSSGFEAFLNKPENQRTAKERLMYEGPLYKYRDGQILSSGKVEDQEKNDANIQDMYTKMGEAIIASLQEIIDNPEKRGKWDLPWRTPEFYGRNPTRKNRIYQGMNQLMLSHAASKRDYKTNRWAGITQWRELKKGVKLKKGEVGVNILVPYDMRDSNGVYIGKGFKIETVYNADQMEGLPDWVYKVDEVAQLSDAERLADIENVVKEIGPKYREQGFRAFYSPADDTITIPPFAAFKDPTAFYATMLHEIIHWTGSPGRLNRDKSGNRFGNEGYAFEELIAEIGSSFAMGFLGLEPEIRDDHIQYLASWLQVLKNDPGQIRKALEQSQQAVDYIMNKSATLRRRAGVPDNERKGKEDYTIEVPIIGKITIPIIKPKRPKEGDVPVEQPKPKARIRVRGSGPGAVKTILEDYENNRLSSGISGFVIKDEEGNYYNQINQRLSSGRGPIVGAKDPNRKIERTEGSFMEKFGMKFEPTDEQKDVMDAVAHLTNNEEGGLVAVRAGAGTGKTTTVEQSVIRMAKESPKSKYYYITFNRKNAAEAQRRMPDNTGSSSINQLAYWSLLLEDRDAITPEYKEKLRKIGVGPGDEFYAAANPKSKRKTEAVGFGGKTVDTTGKKKVGFRTLGYVSFETQSGGKDVSKHYDLKKLYPEGITHENVKLDDVDFGLVLINALTRYSQSEDDVLSEKHFKLRPHEIKRNAQGGVDPAETDFKEIPKEWVDFATKMWADIMDPESNVLPNFDQQVKIWALQRPNLRTDAGMVGHGTRKVKDARSQDKNLEVGSIVQIDGEDFVYTGGGRGALRRRYATEENPLNVFFFDEAQDVNPVLLKVIEDNIRDNNLATVMVGDPRQSIYGFRGSTDSFAKLDPDFNLTLTDSFRYGKTTAFIGNLILGRGNAADRENGVPDVAANYQLFGRLQDVVRADFNLGTLSGAQLAKKLDSIEKKYGITGPNGQKLADMPEKERNDLLTKVVSYLAPEREGILYRQIPADADGTWAFISYSNRNTLEEALQFLSQHQDKTIGLPAEKYKDMVEFLRHLLWVKRPTGTRPRESKIIGNVWDAAEINKRASQKSSYGQLASMMKLLRVRDANGNQLSEIDWLNRLLGRKDPKTGEILERARIRPLEEPIDVDPFKNIDGTSSIVSGAELKMLGALKAGKGGGGKVGGYKLNRDKRFNIVPNPSGQSPSREIFWKLDTEGLKDGESWENGVIISGEGIIDSYEFKDAAGKIQRTGDKNGEKPIARRRLETFINDLGLGDKITIAPKYVPRKAGSSNAPSYDAIRIKGSTPDETGTLLSLVGKFITDTTNDPEVDASFLTTHAAKGLEFDNVILGNDFFQPEFDNAGNVVTDIDREMENLIYVAATRAKRRIQMSDATAWIIDRKKNKRGFEFVEKNLSAEQQAPSGFWNPFDESAEQVYPDGARELASGRALSVSAPAKATRKLGNAPEGRGTNRQERRQRLRSGATPNTDGFAFLDEDTMKQDLQKFATGNFNNRPVDRHIGPDYKRFTPDPIELEERRKHEALIERWGKEGLGWQTAGWTQADKYKSPDYLRGRELGINQARVKWLGDAQERPRDFNEKQKASATYRSWFYSYVRQLGTYLDANRREDDKYWEGVEDGARQSIATHMPMTDTWMREDVDNMVDWMRQYGFGPSGEKIKKETVKPQRLLSSGAVRARPTASGMPAKRERRMASGAVYSQNVSATNLAAIRGSKSGSDYEFARRFWDGFRKRGITLDTSSKAPSAQERRRQINAGLDKVSGAMRNRPEIKIGSVSQNARLDNPDSTTWMLPVSKLRESIRIPTEFDVARNPDNTVRDVNWTKSEPISISDLAKIMNLSPQDKKKLTSDDAGISHDSVRYLIAELGNQPEFAGWRLFSPVTDDEPGNARMSQAQRFAENLGRANMRDRFIIEAFGKDAYPFWYDGSEKEIIDADEYSSLGEVDPAAKFNAVGRFSRNPDDASGEAMAESDLIYEGMPDVSTRRAEEIAKTEEAPQITDKTSRKDFELKKLLDHLGLSEDERGMQELNTRLQKAFGVQDSDLFNPRQASSWRSGGVPTAYIKEMIRTGMIPDAKTVWNDNNVGQKLDDELLSSRNNVFEAAIEFLGKTQGMSAGNTKQNKEYILGAKNLAMVLPQAARTKGKSFSKKKGDEPRFSRQELQGIVNRFNEIFNTNHTIDDIFSREQLETARKRLEEEGRTVFGRSSKD
jgi:antirestriction protein ArdC